MSTYFNSLFQDAHYFTRLSLPLNSAKWFDDGGIMNWKETETSGLALIEIISNNLLGKTQDNHEKTVRIAGVTVESRTETSTEVYSTGSQTFSLHVPLNEI
jgi:hypothetical protein